MKYSNIPTGALEENKQRTKTAYDPSQLIKAMYTQLNQSFNFSDTAATPFNPRKIVAMAYNLVFKTGLYNNTCHKCIRRLPYDKTWANFQADFSAAAQEIHK